MSNMKTDQSMHTSEIRFHRDVKAKYLDSEMKTSSEMKTYFAMLGPNVLRSKPGKGEAKTGFKLKGG